MSNYNISTKNFFLHIQGDTDTVTIYDKKSNVVLRNYSIRGLVRLLEKTK